ncbi:CHAP domain-containing protein [Rhodobacter sp. SGA-6-6]|uniref:CHAP domain-containing protein n=1 Tax=Rhodobacter sp. SGA-6-6 TaxID=2710882 RepID=UPI001F119168|nr:CHAP domain-containing protein [Rhodobacter sp. SGA-6-6]
MTTRPFAALCLAFSLMQPVPAAFAETQPQPQKAGFFLFGKKAAKKAARVEEAERAAVKEMVAYATANKPKGRIWCVPFARTVSGVQIKGNANTWWKKAAGVYERGHAPKVGAVMAFAASKAMPMGHVAVVSKVVSEREILIDQANWERNRITQDTLVVDVSEKGDWSMVRVANAAGTLGRTNPVNGFIYN